MSALDWMTVGGALTRTPAFSPGHALAPPTAVQQSALVESTPAQTFRQPQPIVLIDPSVLYDRMSTIDLSALTRTSTSTRGASSRGWSSCSSGGSSMGSVWTGTPDECSDKVGVSSAHDVSERPSLFSSSISAQNIMSGSQEYTLSSNPPNPKTSFRLGDWICPSLNCAAHNFGRNLSCIGCGSSRATVSSSPQTIPTISASRSTASSPRFTVTSHPGPSTYYSTGPTPPQQHLTIHPQPIASPAYPNPPSSPFHIPTTPSSPSPTMSSQQQKPSHPLLTPSGRAFAVGGRVQNISTDPRNPCILYWPDNEPLPDQGQIRPPGLVGVPQPPILNTGNRGPISHQPGDWICQKCNYLNWRRRKVCQTCLPYAEGNGDSVSTAVQAERIALLTSVLVNTRIDTNSNLPTLFQPSQHQVARSHSLTPPQLHERRSFIESQIPSHPRLDIPTNRSVHRSRSHYALGQQYNPMSQQTLHSSFLAPTPIYQTPQPQRQPSPLLYSTGLDILTRRGVSPAAGRAVGNGSPLGILNGGFNGQQYDFDNGNAGLRPQIQAPAPAPLLPSFLQDIVQSPTLSPTSTTASSVDLSSAEENDELASPVSSASHLVHGAGLPQQQIDIKRPVLPRSRGGSGSSSSASSSSLLGDNLSNIWRMDGDESKGLTTGFNVPGTTRGPLSLPLPTPVGAERKKARAGL